MIPIKVVENFISKDDIQSMIEYIDYIEENKPGEFNVYQDGKRLALKFGDDLFHKEISRRNLDLLSETGKKEQVKKYFQGVVDATKESFGYNDDLYVCSFWLAKQYAGAEVPEHEDTDGLVNLHFRYSAVLYLNELTYGGELAFLAFGYSYKPKAGDLVIFPTYGTGMHAVLEIPETRYSLPFWMTNDKTFALLN
jgi:hypothetical protein